MRLCTTLLALLTTSAALLMAPVPALAAPDTVIDFEAMPPNTRIIDQYAASGVRFGTARSFGLPAPPRECGAPYAVGGGISGTSAQMACASGPVEFPDRRFGTAFEFSTERRAVRFKLSQRVTDRPLNADVRAYAIGGTLIEQRSVALAPNAVVQVAFSGPTSAIAAIVISGDLDSLDSGLVLLDDIVATLDDVPPPPKFSLALATPSIEVVEGSTAEATVSVRRFNGSSGPVTLSVGELPPGIVATQFTPNPVTGTNPAALRITAGSPLSGQRQITVKATGGGLAGTAIGTQLVQTVTGTPAVQIPEGGRFPIRLVPGCGPQTEDDGFTVRGGFHGSVVVSTSAATGGLSASAVPSSVTTAGNGFYPVKLSLDPGSADSSGHFDLNVRPSGATPASLRLNWRTDRMLIHRVSPSSVARPLVDGGSRVAVIGDFPPGCAVTFQDGAGQTWTERSRERIEEDGRALDRIVLELPTTAVSGPLRAVSPTGAVVALSARVDVTDFRNFFALSQANSGPGARAADYTWGDFEGTFGDDDTEACFIFCVRDPIAVRYYDRFRAGVQSGNGLCAGWSMMALRFRGFQGAVQRPSDYQPGATRAWQIAPLNDGTAVKRDVVRWHVAQNDKGFVEDRNSKASQRPAEERQLLRELISKHGGAYVSIRQGSGGHAVVAYAIQDAAGGGVTLSVYDPNVPYSTLEETSSAVRTGALSQSTITIDAAGNWSGSSLNWTGNNSTLRVLHGLPAMGSAELPYDFSIASLFDLSPGPASAAVTGIEAGGEPALGPGGEPRPGSGVTLLPPATGARAVPEYVLEGGRKYELSVRGTRAGRYVHGLWGRGAAATVRGAAIAPGQQDLLTVRPGAAQLAFSTGAASAPVTYDLVDEVGKATRTATVQTTASKGGDDRAALDGRTLRLTHNGAPTSVTVMLGSVGEGLPGSVTTVPLKVGRGERLELRPRSWAKLSGGIGLTVRNARGKVVRRGSARLTKTKAVAIAGVAARRRGKKVTVTGRVTKRGSAPVLAATVELMRGRKVVGRKSATLRGAGVKAGRFSLPVTLGRMPGGTRPRVTVTLLDEAGLASVQRTVVVRG